MGICDLCGAATREETKLFAAGKFGQAVSSGLRPPNSVWEGSTAQLSGASKTEWEAGWIQMAKHDTTAWSLCKSCADKVDALLATSQKCFIATAAFESNLAPEIHWLTTFRDQILHRYFYGRTLIRLYYVISPPLADLVAKTELTKAAVRLCLRPILSICKRRLSN